MSVGTVLDEDDCDAPVLLASPRPRLLRCELKRRIVGKPVTESYVLMHGGFDDSVIISMLTQFRDLREVQQVVRRTKRTMSTPPPHQRGIGLQDRDGQETDRGGPV